MTTALRLISLEDIELILPFVPAYQEFEEVEMTDKERESSVRGLISGPKLGGIWIIYNDSKPVGYIALCVGYSFEFGGLDAIIDEFYILPKYRGKGLGRKALELIKIESKKIGLRALHLEVVRTNSRAQSLYSRAQFKAREKYILMSVTLN